MNLCMNLKLGSYALSSYALSFGYVCVFRIQLAYLTHLFISLT